MNAVFAYLLPREVKSPVRASSLCANWLSLSFFKQTCHRKQLSESLGRQ